MSSILVKVHFLIYSSIYHFLLLSSHAGLCQEGVYQRPGDSGRVALLLEEFTRDARNVKLREKEHHLEDVTGTLKSFLSQAEDALLTKELYPYWVSALGT